MYGDIEVKVLDGNLGRSTVSTGTGVQVKIGLSNVVSSAPLLVTGTMKSAQIQEVIGNTPLADACMDAIDGGANEIYCIPVKAVTDGIVGELAHTGTGTGSVTVSGKPNNAYKIVLEVIGTGDTNGGSFRYSTSGGSSYTDEMTIPVDGIAELQYTGLKVKFTDDADKAESSFIEGDKFQFSTTAPAMSNQDVITAMESLVNYKTAFEFIHIVGESTKALWASLAALAEEFTVKHKRPIWVICEARAKKTEETLKDYAAAMAEERKGINSYYLQVVCSNARYVRMDGREQDINNAGIISGMYCRARESQSIGEVKSFPISKIVNLLPIGIEDYISQLDKAGYTTIRQYAGLENYFVTSANMMAAESDYKYAEDVRVLNRIVKAVRQKALYELQTEVDPDDTAAFIASIEANLNTPLEDAKRDNIISLGTLSIDTENLDILTNENLSVKVTYVPMGHVRAMNIEFAVSNPATA